jgi:F-type H+-transporting ATPase subunit delta
VTASVGQRLIAERYARALLEVALDKKVDPEPLGNEVEELSKFLAGQPELADILSSPTIALSKRLAVIEGLFAGKKLSPYTNNLLRLLTTNERIGILPDLAEQYRRLVLEHKNIQPGEVVSAHPMTKAQQERLAENLGKALGRTMELSYRTDPELVGGLVVQVGNLVFDASVVTQLRRFKEKTLTTF